MRWINRINEYNLEPIIRLCPEVILLSIDGTYYVKTAARANAG